MMQTSKHRGHSRRQFLKHAGASAASWLIIPGLPGALPLVQFISPTLRLAVVLPPYEAFPQVGNSFLDGLALFFSTATARKTELLVRQISTRSPLSAATVEPLLRQQRPDVVLSMLNPEVTPELSTLLEVAGVPLFIAHAGANRLEQSSEHVFYNTLGYWQASHRAGSWAAEQLGKRAVVVSSFYESGYDALYAFQEGFTAAGGSVLETVISHVPAREIGMAELCRRIGAYSPDFVYGHLSGRPAVEFATAYSSSAYTRGRPLLGSGFLTEKALQIELHAAGRDLRSVFSWSPQLDNAPNREFLHAFNRGYGTIPDSFAVLGYETAGLLSAALATATGPGPDLVRALRQARFDGPRGALQFEPQIQSVTPPLYLRHLVWEDGAYRNKVLAPVSPMTEQLAQRQALRSGWLNPYLSI